MADFLTLQNDESFYPKKVPGFMKLRMSSLILICDTT